MESLKKELTEEEESEIDNWDIIMDSVDDLKNLSQTLADGVNNETFNWLSLVIDENKNNNEPLQIKNDKINLTNEEDDESVSSEEEKEEEDEEEDNGAWLPFDPCDFEVLTKEQEMECFRMLQQNCKKHKKFFLLKMYEKNKKNGEQARLLKSTLMKCCYTLEANCFQCEKYGKINYLKNPKRCKYHVLCRECFIFTQTMLSYMWGSNIVECPQQKCFQRCRLETLKPKINT